jgi:parallel beta-helix repeat protein
MKRIVSLMILVLLFTGTFMLAFNVQLVKSDYAWTGTIYIQADGSVQPSTAPISSVDNVTYTLTDNIVGNVPNGSSAIIIERDNIIIDGAGHTLSGSGASAGGYGFNLTGVNLVTIENTTITSFNYGILLCSSSNDSVIGNNLADNLASGVAVESNSPYGIWLNSSNDDSVNGNNITANFGVGVVLSGSNNNSVNGNNITANYGYGLWLDVSNDDSVSGNNIAAYGEYGIILEGSNDDSVNGNNVTAVVAISFANSYNSSVSGNSFVNCGLYVFSSYGNVMTGNLVNGRPLVYLENVSDSVVEGAGQVILVNCNNVTVENCDLSNTYIGVELWGTSNSTISGNDITSNIGFGIYLDSSSNNNSLIGNNLANNEFGIVLESSSSNNSIIGNNIARGEFGVFLGDSSNNIIYHNNFMFNTLGQASSVYSINVWDDGYPSGGNYWSNYTGVDLYSGPYQNQTGSDGIGDTPYIIDANDIDHYPLMNRYNGSPFVNISPRSATLDVGQSQLFTSIITGETSQYTYQWYLNGLAVQNATFSSWTFTPTSSSSYAVYLNVTDSAGVIAISNIVTANVNGPTSVFVLPSSIVMNVGQSQTFNSTVSSGTFPYIYQWYLNGSAVPGATSGNWTFTPTSEGSYIIYANVTDSVGVQAASNTVNVTVNDAIHDVALTGVTVPVSEAYEGWVLNFNVTVANFGNVTETFSVTLSYNSTSIATFVVDSLAPNSTQTLLFSWNTTNVPCGNYTIQAETVLSPGETNLANNVLVDGTLRINLMGDVNGEGKVDMNNIMTILNAFGSYPGHPRWNPACDLNQDGRIDLADIVTALMNFGKTS